MEGRHYQMLCLSDSYDIPSYERYDVLEVAQLLDITVNELYEMIANGDIDVFEKTSGGEFMFFGFNILYYLLDEFEGELPEQGNESLTIWRYKKVQAVTGLARTTIMRLEQEGMFPKRVVTKPIVGWYELDVLNWMKQKK